jgi:hypothetical protein
VSDDIRLLTTFFDHHKTHKLKRRLGHRGLLHLIMLWCWTRQNRTDGMLTGMDAEDIEIAAGWDGDVGAFVAVLVDLRWLDELDDGGFRVHGWEEHQGWSCGAKARSEQAKRAARARWERRFNEDGSDNSGCPGDAGAMPEQCPSNARAMPDPKMSNAP